MGARPTLSVLSTGYCPTYLGVGLPLRSFRPDTAWHIQVLAYPFGLVDWILPSIYGCWPPFRSCRPDTAQHIWVLAYPFSPVDRIVPSISGCWPTPSVLSIGYWGLFHPSTTTTQHASHSQILSSMTGYDNPSLALSTGNLEDYLPYRYWHTISYHTST